MNMFKVRLLSIFILGCLLAAFPGSYAQAGGGGAIIYVDRDAMLGLNNGTSWMNAYTNLQTALSQAANGDKIWVAEGTYKPYYGATPDRNATFDITKSVTLYGGFDGTETAVFQRDLTSHVTILSGDIGTQRVSADNSYHVVHINMIGHAILDGFTITSGNANGAYPANWGGGLLFWEGGSDHTLSLDLRNIVFSNNLATVVGGGLYAFYGDLTLDRVIFQGNTSAMGGGLATQESVITLTNTTFKNNTAAARGGGIYNSNSTITISNSTFSGNSVNTAGGGGINNDSGTLTVSNSTFSGNSVNGSGVGGGIHTGPGSTLTVSNSTFYDNVTVVASGAGIYSGGTLIVSHSTFSDNRAGSAGGAIRSDGSLTLNDSILANSVLTGSSTVIQDCARYAGTFDGDHNLIESNGSGSLACGTPLLTSDPDLGPLQDNGGFTQTMALRYGSPALNAGDDADCPATDQRGITRPQGTHCDIGAYEKEPAGTWYVYGTGNYVFGEGGDIPVVADYNGDGKADIAVFRPSNNTWYVYGVGNFLFGDVGDIPVVADYNGDGKADIAVFRPSNNTWYVYGVGNYLFGDVGDIPVVGDYNGDGKADIAVFRPSNNTWYVYGVGNYLFGDVGDVPVVGDYNGDKKADIAVFRPSDNTWYVYGVGNYLFGDVGDVPVVGDYNGDGKADVAVFRPSNNTWYVYGVGNYLFGDVGDIPVVGDYNGDGKAEIAVFRP